MSSSTSSSDQPPESPTLLGPEADRQPIPGWATWRLLGVGLILPVLGVVVLELTCRWISPVFLSNPNPEEIQVSGPGYRKFRPGMRVDSNVGGTEVSFAMNSDGFRDRDVPAKRDCLIVGVGNSFVANWALHPDAFWTSALERRLAHGTHWPACAVRSVGFQGWTLDEIYAALLDKQATWRPDVVVLLFSGATMWTEHPIDVAKLGQVRQRWNPEGPEAHEPPPPEVPTLMTRLIGLYNRLESHMALLGTLKRAAPMLSITAGLSQLMTPMSFETARIRRFIGPTLTAVGQLDTLLRANGTRLVVVRVPELPEVDDDVYYVSLAQRGSTSRGLDRAAAGRALADGCRAAGIPFADLLPAFRHAEQPAFNLIDQHWNEYGNETGAEVVQRLLEGLPPPTTSTPTDR